MGKSTLINSLFMTDLYKDKKPLGVEGKILIVVDNNLLFLIFNFVISNS